MSAPRHPDAFSTEWLERALGAPAGSLGAFAATPIGTGQMSLSFRISLEWREQRGPASIVAKCSSLDPGTRAIAKLLRNYALELGWYRDLAPTLGVACPRCLHLSANEDETEFMLLLADLAPAVQGDQLTGATVRQVEAALIQAARLHAPFWGSSKLDAIPWLRSHPGADNAVREMVPALYGKFRERYADRLSGEVWAQGDRLIAGVSAYFDYVPVARTIQHRDLRLDNLLFDPDGGAHVVDWQTLGVGSGAADLAYLIGTSLANRTVRAANERQLVERYVRELVDLGASAGLDDVWREYRLYAFSGFIMAVIASMNVVRTPRGDEMFAVMAERSAWQASDLGSLTLLA